MTKARMCFAMRGEGSDTLEIDIFDTIGATFFGDGVDAKGIRAKLAENKGAKLIRLTVNSRGGDVIDGMAIYSMLHEHEARVEAEVPGLAASIASVILMAADKITVSASAMIMIHNAWGFAMGTPDEMRDHAALLEKMSAKMVDIYAARTGQTPEKLKEMMSAETWMDSSEALANGFADEVTPAKAKALAHIDLTGLRAPAPFMAAVAQARAAATNNDGAQRAQENDTMTEDQILAALGCKSLSDAKALIAKGQRFEKIEASASAKNDEAQGVVLAALNSHAELPKAQARIAELEAKVSTHALDGMIAQAKDAKKLTPAIEASVRAAVAAGDVTIKGAEAWLANLAPIAALVAAKKEEAGPLKVGADAKHNGKTYAEMKPAERAALKRENPELFAAMRSASN